MHSYNEWYVKWNVLFCLVLLTSKRNAHYVIYISTPGCRYALESIYIVNVQKKPYFSKTDREWSNNNHNHNNNNEIKCIRWRIHSTLSFPMCKCVCVPCECVSACVCTYCIRIHIYYTITRDHNTCKRNKTPHCGFVW